MDDREEQDHVETAVGKLGGRSQSAAEGEEDVGFFRRISSQVTAVAIRYSLSTGMLAIAIFVLLRIYLRGIPFAETWRNDATFRWLPVAVIVAIAIDGIRDIRSRT